MHDKKVFFVCFQIFSIIKKHILKFRKNIKGFQKSSKNYKNHNKFQQILKKYLNQKYYTKQIILL